jgi:hypothetical protein
MCLFTSCGGDSDSPASSSSSSITISGAFNLSKSTNIGINSVADNIVFCMAFDVSNPASGTSEIDDSDGSFAVTGLPADTALGCFLRNSNNTQTLATFEFVDSEGTGYGDATSTSASITTSVSLGDLSYTEGQDISVDRSVLAGKTTAASSSFNIASYHDTSWTMSCPTDGDAVRLAACECFITDGCEDEKLIELKNKALQSESNNTVYFRILEATKDSDTVYGIGIWANKTAFTECGGIDMSTETKSDIQSEGYTFSDDVLSDTDFTTGTSCPEYEWADEDESKEDKLENYYAMQPLNIEGDSATMLDETSYDYTGDSEEACSGEDNLSVTFSPISETQLSGAFSIEMSDSCDSDMNAEASFDVVFTKSE